METYALEWVNLILRWLHVIAGIAWIGTSFHFMWLDHSLNFSSERETQGHEIGHVWFVHSGGFYEVTKYRLLPETMLDHLHWFKWEAYSTWLSGMALLTVIYYVGAEYSLIDEQVADLTQWQAIGIGLGFLVGGWFLYDLLCKSHIANNKYLLALMSLIVVMSVAFVLTQIFSAQGAFMHVGAMIGTVMAGNVFMVIIPAQKALVAAVTDSDIPDIKLATKAKLRSTHNYYATLPLLFIMISNHYPIVYMYEYNWLVLTAIVAITSSIQHYFNLKHKGINKPCGE
jgi:uncharacterized membrane protein